jgi:hypothetical protein
MTTDSNDSEVTTGEGEPGHKADPPERLPDEPAALARSLANPAASALRVIQRAETANDREFMEAVDWAEYVKELMGSSAKLRAGDLTHIEDMLMHQATALQAVFSRLTERGLTSTHPATMELMLRFGLRAQAQCRATLETLANVKNPPVIYARQANVTTGPQQVNNGVSHAPAESGDKGISPIKLSREIHELRPNRRTPALESRADTPLATVGTIDGAPNGGGQGEGRPKCVERRSAADAQEPRARVARSGRGS